MKINGRSVAVSVLLTGSAFMMSGCTSTGEFNYDFNKLAFWKTPLSPEEQALADRQEEIDEQRRIKAELKRKIAAELKAEKEEQLRIELEAKMRAEQAAAKIQADQAEAKAKAELASANRKAAAMATLKEKMRSELIAEMEAEAKAKEEAKARAAKEAARKKAEAEALEKERLEKKKAREFTNLTEEEKEDVRALAGGYAENFLQSLDKGDYAGFKKNMAPSLLKTLEKKKFVSFSDQVKKMKGDLKRFHYMGEIKSGVFVTLVYKVEYALESKKTGSNDESMLRLALAELDDKYMVWSFSLD